MPRKPVKKKVTPQKAKPKKYDIKPNKAEAKQRDEAQKQQNKNVRQAIHGGTIGGRTEGVTIISGRPLPVGQRPEIISKSGKR